MRTFLLFFVCFLCFAHNGEGVLWDAWSRLKSSANRFSVKNASDCIRDEDTVLGPVYCMVREEANAWWKTDTKLADVVAVTTLVSGAFIIGAAAPDLYAGKWNILPSCLCSCSRCSPAEVSLYFFKAAAVGISIGVAGCMALIDGASAVKKFAEGVADSVADSMLEVHKVYGD